MRMNKLGRTGLFVSELGLGAMTNGSLTEYLRHGDTCLHRGL